MASSVARPRKCYINRLELFIFNKLTSVCSVVDHEFRYNIVKVAVDPRGDSRVDPQTILTML